jgi:hypothetical protein
MHNNEYLLKILSNYLLIFFQVTIQLACTKYLTVVAKSVMNNLLFPIQKRETYLRFM